MHFPLIEVSGEIRPPHNSTPSLRSVVAALRDAQTFRGSAPSGFQGSDSLREPPPSFLPRPLDGLVSKIHPRARPAKPDHPAFCYCATSRCGPLSLSRLLHRESRVVRFHLTRTQAVRPDAAHPGFALNGLHQGRTEKFGLGAIFPHPPSWARVASVQLFPPSSPAVYQSG